MKAAKLWIDLCAIYTYEEGAFEVVFDDENRLIMLEQLGFIVSTDVEKALRIKVNGLKLDHVGLYFCPMNCEGDLEKE